MSMSFAEKNETVESLCLSCALYFFHLQGRGALKRVDEVFDCWFESGSMPYAQLHYPFENVDRFEKGFPADFIAEGLDQTRGWFYTLMVISTCLFNKPGVCMCICVRAYSSVSVHFDVRAHSSI